MKKHCILCSAEFEAKRSDAQYCSEKCRAKANYEKNRKKDELNTSSVTEFGTTGDESLKVRIHAGDLDFKELKALLTRIEKDLDTKNIQITELEQDNLRIQSEILLLNQQILSIKNDDLDKLLKLIEMPDFYIYNNYLNEDYLKAKKSGDKFARNTLKSDDDLQRFGNNEIRLKIGNFRLKLALKSESIQKKIEAIEMEISIKQNNLRTNTEKIKCFVADIKFYQSRILKYDSLLSG